MEENSKHSPPRLFHSLFRWFCKTEFQEDIEGDLLERFDNHVMRYGIRKAKRLFVKDVLLLMKPSIVRNLFDFSLLNHFAMKKYYGISFRLVGVIFGLTTIYFISERFNRKIDNVSNLHGDTSIASKNNLYKFKDLTWSKTPVSNHDWLEFVTFIQNDPSFSSEYITSMLPDDWEKIPLEQKQNNQPVVGVSWYQANEFLNWKSVLTTYETSHSQKSNYEVMTKSNALSSTKITYRLPSQGEWNKFAAQTQIEEGGFHFVRIVSGVI